MAIGNQAISITLTEDDIPGAKLSELWEKHTNQALRWWLLCHGIQVPVSLTKAKLIGRYLCQLIYEVVIKVYSLTLIAGLRRLDKKTHRCVMLMVRICIVNNREQ